MSRFRVSPRDDFRWQRGPLARNALAGEKAVVVGGTGGIGRAIARELGARGAEVTVVGRTFRDAAAPRLGFIPADLARMRDAQNVARELPAEDLDLLILTAGIMAGKDRVESPEGIELDLAVSYLSRYVIVRELAQRLGKERHETRSKPRVFVVAFPGTDPQIDISDLNSEREYKPMITHAKTVMGNEALVLDSASRYPQVNFYGLNPGMVKSNIRAAMLGEGSFRQTIVESLIGVFMQTPDRYSARIVPLLVSPDIENHSGAMFDRRGDPIQGSRGLADPGKLEEIMASSERLVDKALSAGEGPSNL